MRLQILLKSRFKLEVYDMETSHSLVVGYFYTVILNHFDACLSQTLNNLLQLNLNFVVQILLKMHFRNCDHQGLEGRNLFVTSFGDYLIDKSKILHILNHRTTSVLNMGGFQPEVAGPAVD